MALGEETKPFDDKMTSRVIHSQTAKCLGVCRDSALTGDGVIEGDCGAREPSTREC